MKKNITRRDFLNGAALALATGATLGPRGTLALEEGAAARLRTPACSSEPHFPP